MTTITQDTRFRSVDGIEINRVPDGAMIYQNERERVHYLNVTALIVFELCAENKTTAEIGAFLTNAFALDAPPTESLYACLSNLVDEGLVACSPSSAER